MMGIKWNEGQRECMSLFNKEYKAQNKQTFEYDGPAGTGKTSIIPEMLTKAGLDIEEEVMCMAYTGRASSNLSMNGLEASSIHSSLMHSTHIPKTDSEGNTIYVNGRPMTEWSFQKKDFLPKSIKLLVIDEGRMVDTEMAKIAMSFGLPILVSGDTEQLDPIYGDPYFLEEPDYTLTEITRQAKNSGIIELATRIRLGQEIPDKKYKFKNDAFILPKKEITDTILINSSIILCRKNKTRNYFNNRIRNGIFGIDSKLPIKGDKVICRKNYWNRELGDIPLTNGILGHILHDVTRSDVDVKARTVKVDFQPDYIDYDYYDCLPVDIDFFIRECSSNKVSNRYNKGVKLELGHAITTYLAQGSQFNSVLYWDEEVWDKDLLRKLRYTGVTRAEKIAIYAP